jgi:hypothetical protein
MRIADMQQNTVRDPVYDSPNERERERESRLVGGVVTLITNVHLNQHNRVSRWSRLRGAGTYLDLLPNEILELIDSVAAHNEILRHFDTGLQHGACDLLLPHHITEQYLNQAITLQRAGGR